MTAQQIRPLFLFSLPRSGSTLVQRVLATHPEVATTSEPWLLLPLLYGLRRAGTFTEYDHGLAHRGIQDFLKTAEGGEDAFLEAVRLAAAELYRRASDPDARYFLDKTPRYALIADEVRRTFPEAPIIILWRNPLAIAASMVETWGGGHWNTFRYKVDLYSSLECLIELQRRYPKRVFSVRYEDLITDPAITWPRIFKYLRLDYDPTVLSAFSSTRLSGTMGDRTGTKRYSSLSDEPLAKWQATFRTPVRKAWGRSYLNWIGAERLQIMGYSAEALQDDLNAAPSNIDGAVGDAWWSLYGVLYHTLELRQLRAKVSRLRCWPSVHAHR